MAVSDLQVDQVGGRTVNSMRKVSNFQFFVIPSNLRQTITND
jgi:hypothetical protein